MEPVTEAELKKLEEMILATIYPERGEGQRVALVPDPAGYYWSKGRNALNHYANPHFLERMIATIRGGKAG